MTALAGDDAAAFDAIRSAFSDDVGSGRIRMRSQTVAGGMYGRDLLVVGPEGGITGDELHALVAAGARAVRLGPEVLRASTAAAVALGALGVLTGRWGGPPTS